MGTAGRRPGRPKGARTKAPAERRRELIEAAVAAVRKVGPDASMDDIAAEAGITKAVLYDHFDGKDGLQRSVVESFGDALLARLASGMEVERTPKDLVHDAVAAFASFAQHDAAVFRFASRSEHSLRTEASGVFTALIAQSLQRAGADDRGAAVYASAALGAVFAAVEDWIDHGTPSRAEFVDLLTDMLWDGLGATGLERLEGPVDMTPAIEALTPPDAAGR